MTIKRLLSKTALLTALGAMTACAFVGTPKSPIPSHALAETGSDKELILLLPGFGDEAQDFADNGIVDLLRSCRPNADIVGVDAHFGYYRTRTIETRLHEDILRDARSKYEQITLMGISMGGFGSILYSRRHNHVVDRIFLVAPYFGDEDELAAYQRGIANPELAGEAELDPDFVAIWDWMRTQSATELYLATGEQDSMYPQHRWLMDIIGEDRVVTRPGGHKWTVWRALWPTLMAQAGYCDN